MSYYLASVALDTYDVLSLGFAGPYSATVNFLVSGLSLTKPRLIHASML